MQTFKAKLKWKGEVVSGVSQRTGNEWTRQDMRFVLLHDDGTETSEEVAVSCMNKLVISAPAMVEGVTGRLDVYLHVREYNGKIFQDVQLNMFTPMEFGVAVMQPAQVVQQPVQQQVQQNQPIAQPQQYQQAQQQYQQQPQGMPFGAQPTGKLPF